MEGKILVLGVDGMDPRLANHFVAKGVMPNLAKLIENGSCTKDLVMLGALPTITPPLWTTLATGSYPGTHGITCFWAQSHDQLDTLTFTMDSRLCKSELLWNVLAEAGHKTLVWHWPGCSWPPSSQSENLHVVDGTQPNTINVGCAVLDTDKMVLASAANKTLTFGASEQNDTGAGCVLTGLEELGVPADDSVLAAVVGHVKESRNLIMRHEDGDAVLKVVGFDQVNSPIVKAYSWAFPTQEELEFYILTMNGTVRWPVLLRKNEQGVYDRIEIYTSKKASAPLVTLAEGAIMENVLISIEKEGVVKLANRHMRLMDLAADGSSVRLWLGSALEAENNSVWHPKRLFDEVTQQVGWVPSTTLLGAKDHQVAEKIILPSWDIYIKWQARAMRHIMDREQYDVVFSHLHNVDNCGHAFWELGRIESNEQYQQYLQDMEEVYRQTDWYFGEFMSLLDEDWTIFVVSDHGLLIAPEEAPLLGDGFGCNIGVMQELGYTVLQQDADGQILKEIDWSKTRAIASRTCHIWLNLKERYETGIVSNEEKYDLEEQIISDLYSYRLNGHRVVSFALRNKDAKLLGGSLTGHDSNYIIFFKRG